MAKKVLKLKAEKRQQESYAFREEKGGGKHTNERSSWGQSSLLTLAHRMNAV
jgi:hypothetical protein